MSTVTYMVGVDSVDYENSRGAEENRGFCGTQGGG